MCRISDGDGSRLSGDKKESPNRERGEGSFNYSMDFSKVHMSEMRFFSLDMPFKYL
jgi:hypothetical protein